MNVIILKTILAILSSEGVTDTIWLHDGNETLVEYLIGKLDYPQDVLDTLFSTSDIEMIEVVTTLLKEIKK